MCYVFLTFHQYWAEYKTGIKEFKPWLEAAEKKSTEGLPKPQTLEEATGMFSGVNVSHDKVV